VQNAALADLGAVAVEEFDRVLAGVDLVLVELADGGDGEDIENREASGAQRQALGNRFVQKALPSGEAETRKEAGDGVPAVLQRLP